MTKFIEIPIRARCLRKEWIGEVCVDSGQLMIVDPCYMDKWNHGDSFEEACFATCNDDRCGQIVGGLGLAFQSGYGDGIYDVYAFRNEDGEIMKLEIDMRID